MTQSFSWHTLEPDHVALATDILGGLRRPDLVIAPDGDPYLYRWHIIPRNPTANVYFHIQVASDPERPLHDHPWDNQSVILAGGYEEIIQRQQHGLVTRCTRGPGEVVFRRAEEAHRLLLPAGVPYTMTLFSTGPHRRPWGFWIPSRKGPAYMAKWVDQAEVIENRPDGTSTYTGALL